MFYKKSRQIFKNPNNSILILWLPKKYKETAVVSIALLSLWARSLCRLSKEFASKKRKKFLDGQWSERTHGKRKVAQLKWQLFLFVDSQSIYCWTNIYYISINWGRLMIMLRSVPAMWRCEITSAICIFQRSKLLLADAFPNSKFWFLSKLKNVENKFFHFDTVWTFRFDQFTGFGIDERNFLFSHMMNEIAFMFTDYPVKKLPGEEVNTDIGSWIS